jgi:hypothetical protein
VHHHKNKQVLPIHFGAVSVRTGSMGRALSPGHWFFGKHGIFPA